MLEGFETFSVTIGAASISVSEYGISFSKTSVIRLGKAEYVKLLINANTKEIAIQISDKNTEDSIKFYTGQKSTSVRWNYRELQNTISDMMDWDLKEYIYKVEGKYFHEDKALVFDLKSASKQKASKKK